MKSACASSTNTSTSEFSTKFQALEAEVLQSLMALHSWQTPGGSKLTAQSVRQNGLDPRLTRSLDFKRKPRLPLPHVSSSSQLEHPALLTLPHDHLSLIPLISYHSPSVILDLRYPFSCYSESWVSYCTISKFKSSRYLHNDVLVQDSVSIHDGPFAGVENDLPLIDRVQNPRLSNISSKSSSTQCLYSQFPEPPKKSVHSFLNFDLDDHVRKDKVEVCTAAAVTSNHNMPRTSENALLNQWASGQDQIQRPRNDSHNSLTQEQIPGSMLPDEPRLGQRPARKDSCSLSGSENSYSTSKTGSTAS